MKKEIQCKLKKACTTVLAAICVLTVSLCLWGCESNDSDSSYENKDYDNNNSVTTSSISKSQAISIAKGSSKVQNEIAEYYGMKFFYTPDWGTITASQQYDGDWEVVLKGKISGYTDDYKSNFIYDKTFSAKVTVSSSGYVSNIYVTRY